MQSDASVVVEAPTAAPAGSPTSPRYGCGNGMGTGPPGVGTITTCRSTPTTRSPQVAAGGPSMLGSSFLADHGRNHS
jgi:hypothetical protein